MSANGKVHGYKHVAMACQGGGSLGAYIVGSLEAMQEAGYKPDAVAGISIGAFTAAIIAGNEPEHRVEKLKEFWDLISWPDVPPPGDGLGFVKKWHNLTSSFQGFLFGQPEFFLPRFLPPFIQPAGSPQATSFYDTDLLRETLPQVANFDIIKRGDTRLVLGATRVRDGSPKWFDNTDPRNPITPEHVIASGAMPPGFPAVRIDGELYWDGGCYSNTPLDGLYGALRDQGDTLCFVIDLFGPNGREPQDISDVLLTMKEIQYSNRTRRNMERIAERHNHGDWVRRVMERKKGILEEIPHPAEAGRVENKGRFDFIHVLYQKPAWEVPTCDCEFSRSSIRDRMRQGYSDMKKAVAEAPAPVPLAARRVAYEMPAAAVISTFAKGVRVQPPEHAESGGEPEEPGPGMDEIPRHARLGTKRNGHKEPVGKM